MQSNLNEKQKEAVELGLGPAMILAGPGSGKTTVLLHRIKYLIDELHISPNNILVITFTKASAEQMKARAAKILNLTEEGPFFGTIHSYFYSVLKRSYEYQNFSIITTKQKYILLEKLLKTYYPFVHISNNVLKEILACFSRQKNNIDYLKEVEELGFSKNQFDTLLKKYDYFKNEQKQMDYDDIIYLTLKLFEENPFFAEKIRHEIEYILIDEFQDVNAVQYELVKSLVKRKKNIFVVGDDDQSIYHFRGAGEENLKQFETDYPMACKVILNINYRCPQRIVDISSKLISHNQKRFFKQLCSGKLEEGEVQCRKFISKEEERNHVITIIKESLNRKDGEQFAILCRTNSQLSFFAERLKKEEIPYYMKEKQILFYELPHIRPIIGYLMFASGLDQTRRRLFSFINKPIRYINRELFSTWDENKERLDCFYTEDEYAKRELIKLKKQLEQLKKMNPKMAVTYILKGIGYESYLFGRYTKMEELLKIRADIDVLKERACMYESIKEWMKYVKLEENMEELYTKTEAEKVVNVFLYTFHGAKGLEFENVIIPHLNEGSVPYGKDIPKEELEEERRMFYVSLTRSSKNLYITCVENDTKKDTVSRFIKECAITVSK